MKSRRLMSNMALPPGPTDPCNQLAARSADLIRRMSFENPLWGATKIHGRTAQTHADLAHLVPFRTAAFPFSDDVLHRIGLSLEWLPPSTRGNAHRCTIGMGTVCDDPDSDNETPLRLAPYDRRCLNFGGVALPKSYPRAAVSDIACSSLRYKSRQVRWHQWAGKRPADKSCPRNPRGRICRSDASSVYSIL